MGGIEEALAAFGHVTMFVVRSQCWSCSLCC